MAKKAHPFNALQAYLPPGSFEPVLRYIMHYKVQLTISQSRQTILGDYRHAWAGKGHRISVNGNLNKYAFLITLLHELAHLLNFERCGNQVAAHGQEWKQEFSSILNEFIQRKVFPQDVELSLVQSLKNPAASSCADAGLTRVLRKYDEKKPDYYLLEQVPEGCIFSIKGGRSFKKGPKLRTRYKCIDMNSKKAFLFSAVYEVQLPNQSS